ncbi:MAG: 2'-5' RNA ligase family protein [Flavobacteriales bacterium]
MSPFATYRSVWEYLFVLNLGSKAEQEIVALKKELQSKIGLFPSAHSVPHITIGNVILQQKHAEILLQRLDRLCRKTEPFPVHLNNFEQFTQRNIFANPANSTVIVEFMKKCEQASQGLELKAAWAPKQKKPHVTIARGLGNQFEEAWEMFESRSYVADFQVNDLIVLRRLHGQPYEQVAQFLFKSEAVQMKLF